MSERMSPLPFEMLMTQLIEEHKQYGTVFGVTEAYVKNGRKAALPLFGGKLETPFGPAAGPNTQLAQNIIASYFAGARFFELKTVQKMDGPELAACIARPCINVPDEGYNCEWSTELTVPQAFDEYVKAWVALKLISRRWKLGSPDGFLFNMSVGYDLAGIKTKKLDRFIEGMKDASSTPEWAECIRVAKKLFPRSRAYIGGISPHICSGVTVSTLHGCPPREIEAIAAYLIKGKHLNTFVKCNPTILGYDFARRRLDAMGYDYVAFDDHHFREDLQFEDAVPMFERLKALAESRDLEFGLKLSNTFPVDVKAGELPSGEMYMSGRALYPLTVEMAARFSKEFKGALRLSFSGGADYFNLQKLCEAGIWPVTMATTILKPGGYGRFVQLAKLSENFRCKPFSHVNVKAAERLSAEAVNDPHYRKPVKPLPSRKIEEKVPLWDCFTAPCAHGCPIGQDIPEYIRLCEKGLYEEALRVITEKNPLPFITGTICAHRCMDKCTRNFYEESVHIRDMKLIAAQKGYAPLMERMEPEKAKDGPRTAVVGGGPAGISAAYFLARAGLPVTVFEREMQVGGLVRNVIPAFRIPDEAIENDIALCRRMGAAFVTGKDAPSLEELKAQGFDFILLAFGASKKGRLNMEGSAVNAIDFLKAAKGAPETLSLGKTAAVIGGGNTAMDAARAAKRMGVGRVTIVYRRTKKYMPADEEELRLAMEDGVEFAELLSPVRHEGGRLVCRRMKLGEPDASGRRAPVETDEVVELEADTVIAAVGEAPAPDAFARYGVTLDARGKARFDCGNGVYAAGDALRGPATVVDAIADARRFADMVIARAREAAIPAEARRDYRETLLKKNRLCPAGTAGAEASRCLGCSTVCENCVSVCPNRANIAVAVPGHPMRQILHIDRLCNECGNCEVFCPYDSKPYREKFTLFSSKRDFEESENDGFYLMSPGTAPIVCVRLHGKSGFFDLSGPNMLDPEIESFILAVVQNYSYLM